MKICIVGNGLVSLSLAKALVNKGIYVDCYSNQKKNEIDKSRTIGLSKANIKFFEKKIFDIKKLLWNIEKIEIYSENLRNEKVLNFENTKAGLFSILKNHELYKNLETSLKKNKFFKIKKNKQKILIEKYNLLINCEVKNFFTKKYFQNRLEKNYESYAHTTIIEHKKMNNNRTALQFFTKNGPLAFLPISASKTSIVYSARGSKNIDLKPLIKKYNLKYIIYKFNKISNFKLNSLNLRNYHYKNILAFGDLLHKLHPLAGQGFNMSIRDIRLLVDIIEFRLNRGLDLNYSVCKEFEKKAKHKNYIFSSGIDFIYEFFNLESKINNSILSNSLKVLGKNKYTNSFFKKIADVGIDF
tara:strand:- start:216 stop:1283 length:1068 start_codon:yes stop_codon:yes gene_type:complete